MSTVVIGGGDHARAALNDLETASLTMDCDKRAAAEQLVADFTAAAKAMLETGANETAP